ncbi:glycosyltransferase involved in cell wall biosynthesis [Aquabacter spiritensis]|uniref:Glycosyltransferase involved in cell wall biosynthesis n=2 Tax=Aquabacter spiritensis TaxID=933073 RepID=A0A4V2UXM1_9HYPH|nr:glycosyltransferase involved in cell wall biosynthesis [Aquabacter spiritensis]
MAAPVFFDASYLIARATYPRADGFTNVTLAYARHFVDQARGFFVRNGPSDPVVLERHHAHRILKTLDQTMSSRPSALGGVRDWLAGGAPPPSQVRASGLRTAASRFVGDRVAKVQCSYIARARASGRIAEGAVYLNVAQYAYSDCEAYRWLDRRPDVRPVFLVHDLLPLDYPEFFVPGEGERFARRISMALTRGRGLIVTSEDVRARVQDEMARRGHARLPVLVAPFPSPLTCPAPNPIDEDLSAHPYFVMVATIEPRKNHLLMLSIWRELAKAAAAEGKAVPKLILVGRRGRENEQIVDVLDRGRLTQPHVLEIPFLAPTDLSRLIANARGLLMPSFAEGYGLPLVEALAMGTPVVATDAPVFREVTQGLALYRSPIDGFGWQNAILGLSDRRSPEAEAARSSAKRFVAPTWAGYFDSVQHFLKSV